MLVVCNKTIPQKQWDLLHLKEYKTVVD